MKKSVIALVIGIVLLAAVFFLVRGLKPEQQEGQPPPPVEARDEQPTMDFPEPAPGAIVFDVTYRGLSGAKDELRYNAYYGFGGTIKDTPFITEVRKNGGEFSTVYNSYFKGAEWSAVEVKDNNAVAFYFDLNADGKVSENEKIAPIQNTQPGSNNRVEFVTPDFTMTTKDGYKVPFRVLLQASSQSSGLVCTWSPSCVLEGTSEINGRPAKFTGGSQPDGKTLQIIKTSNLA